VLKTLCATPIVRADFINICSEYGVTLNLSYGGLYRKIVDSFRRLILMLCSVFFVAFVFCFMCFLLFL